MRKLTTIMAASLVTSAALAGLGAMTQASHAVVYCTYIGYPVNCVVRPGVRLLPKPVVVVPGPVVVAPGAVVVAPRPVVGAPKPGNWNGGVNRVGRAR